MKKTKAFTIVELLIVIGIIALLISIILPAIQRARGHTSSSTPVQTAPNVWEFNYQYTYDNFSADLAAFSTQHPNLKIDSQTPANYVNGHPWKYVVTTEERPPR